MLRYEIQKPAGISGITCVEVEAPRPGPRQVVIEMKAWTLNYRDLAMPRGGYPGNTKVLTDPPLVPLSDGAGVVVEVGAEVTRFSPGDRVVASFFQDWVSGELTAESKGSALGGAVDGVLAERVVLDERGCVIVPEALSFLQAAALPCAGVTAWAALTGAHTEAGQTALLLGTGGVSIAALQLLKLRGARVIITSSSDKKLSQARELGADETINTTQTPAWDERVLELTGGVGVDHVLEVGGAGTLERSLRATRISGTVSLIGVLSGNPEQNPSIMDALFKRITLRGIYVGSRQMLEELVQTAAAARLEPVIDRVFSFDRAREAYRYLKAAAHFGKVAIEHR